MERKDLPSGCLTAIVTPFNQKGTIDLSGLFKNLEFQISQGTKGVISVGTTGESPTLIPQEHNSVNQRTAQIVLLLRRKIKKDFFVLAGCGSNSTRETIQFVNNANGGVKPDGMLLVDCYYNGPSSLELREEYYKTIAKMFPDLIVVPYIIPGRTGCALSPEDLAILAREYPNVKAVKEATADLERMKRTRNLVPDGFKIFSGDDDKTWQMMTDPAIRADGVISVISNIAPGALQQMCEKILTGDIEAAQKIKEALVPLFKLVTVKKERIEKIAGKGVHRIEDKFRNPLPLKTMMQGLGMPAGPCRPPLGKMTSQAVKVVRDALKEVWENNPWVLKPIEDFYGVDISDRLTDNKIWAELTFQGGLK